MAMTEIIKQLEKEILQQREDEQRILNEIAAVVSLDFAQRARFIFLIRWSLT